MKANYFVALIAVLMLLGCTDTREPANGPTQSAAPPPASPPENMMGETGPTLPNGSAVGKSGGDTTGRQGAIAPAQTSRDVAVKLLTSLGSRRRLPRSFQPYIPLPGRRPFLLADNGSILKVDLSYTPLTDTDMAKMADGLHDVIWLHLTATNITDAGLQGLSTLTKLQELSLRDTQVSSAGLIHISGLTNLKRLSLTNTFVTDLSSTKKLTHLIGLGLRGTKVEDLTPIAGLLKLRELDLKGTRITDISPLAGLQELADLNVLETRITVSQVEALKKSLPACKIMYDRRLR